MSVTVALIGRPNVGKSTLFNRLVGRKLALVDDKPGVTRDLREGEAKLGPLRFTVIDTAGLESVTDDSLPGRMRALTERAIAIADICVFMIDARQGITATDSELASMLRKSGRVTILAANKAEGRAGQQGQLDAYGLGLGEALAISAEHGTGLDQLYDALNEVFPRDALAPAEADGTKPIQIAIVGRPNAGKSTLVNAILGEDRMLTGPEAGITRDAISVEMSRGETSFRIFDTAGMRKRARVQEKLEKLSVADGLRAVRFAEIVVVLLDSQNPFETQDLRIADLAEREGRAVVLAVNKWDLVKDKSAKQRELREAFDRLLPQLKGAPLIYLSAISGKGIDRLFEAIGEVYATWNDRIPTAKLNNWLIAQLAQHPPPAPSGRRIKLRYMTQASSRPPTFVTMCSYPDAMPESYKRFLVNGLRRDFGLNGVPIRLNFRKQDNPYANRRKPNITSLSKHMGKDRRRTGRN